jgi:hypothetical protein
MYSRHTFVPAPSGGVEPLFSDRQSGERPALFEGQMIKLGSRPRVHGVQLAGRSAGGTTTEGSEPLFSDRQSGERPALFEGRIRSPPSPGPIPPHSGGWGGKRGDETCIGISPSCIDPRARTRRCRGRSRLSAPFPAPDWRAGGRAGEGGLRDRAAVASPPRIERGLPASEARGGIHPWRASEARARCLAFAPSRRPEFEGRCEDALSAAPLGRWAGALLRVL